MDGGTVALPLFIVFLVLKLTHVIAWSWLWVTVPIWVSAASGVIVLIFSLVFGFSLLAFVKRLGGV